MLRRKATFCVFLFSTLWVSVAQAASDQLQELTKAIRIADMVEVLRQEGLSHGDDLSSDLMPGRGDESWDRRVSEIYDTVWMEQIVREAFEAEMQGIELQPLLSFFTSDTGREVVELELSTREALLDESKERVANKAYKSARRENSWIYGQVTELIEDSDLIEFNVTGSLNSNMMFYRGMSDGGALFMSEDEMLADVWSQEEAIRSDSGEWLGTYLLMAYQTLEREELEAYAELYRSTPGQKFNAAVFAAYNRLYDEISYALGLAVARHMQSEKL